MVCAFCGLFLESLDQDAASDVAWWRDTKERGQCRRDVSGRSGFDVAARVNSGAHNDRRDVRVV